MAEKITVTLRTSSTDRDKYLMHDQRKFLQTALEISHKRAQSLISQMQNNDHSIVVDLNYRQFARYAALRVMQRNTEGAYRWEYPKVIDFVEDEVYVPPIQPIELRPGLRAVVR